MTTVTLAPMIRQQFFDTTVTGVAVPAANGFVYTYQAGTLTPQATYSDNLSTPTLNANPIPLDSNGMCNMYLDVTLTYKFIVKNSAGVQIDYQDNVPGASSAGTATYATTAGTATSATTATTATNATIVLNSSNNPYALIFAGASPSGAGSQQLQLNQYITVNPSNGNLSLPSGANVSAGTFTSNASSGTPPFTVTSPTQVNNLRAQYATGVYGGSNGQLLVSTGANTTGFLSTGTTGQVLVSAGSGNPPVWGANGAVAYWSFTNPASQNNGVVSWQSTNISSGITPTSGTVSTVTIQTAGVYVLYASVTFTDVPGSSPVPQLIMKKNGSAMGTQQAELYSSGGNPGGQVPVGGVSAITHCAIGDTITVYWGSASGGSLTTGLGTFTGFQIA